MKSRNGETNAFSRFAQHTCKLFSSAAQLALPEHRILECHTVEICLDGVKAIFSENLPPQPDGLMRLAIPARPVGTHPVIAQVRTLYGVFNGTEGGFLVDLRFTDIPAASAHAIQEFAAV